VFNNSVLTDVWTLEAGTKIPWPGVGGFFVTGVDAAVGVDVEVEVEVDMLYE
jgi:hypothetical protein